MMRRRKLMVIQDEDEYFVPDYFQVTSSTSVKRGRRFLVDVYTTPDANKIIITIPDMSIVRELTPSNTTAVSTGQSKYYNYSYAFTCPSTMISGSIVTILVQAYKTDELTLSKPVIREITIK